VKQKKLLIMDSVWYCILGIVILVSLYYIYKKIKIKIMISKDYNRKISKDDLKVRKDLETLRKQLFQSEDPVVNNEILNKIQKIKEGIYPKN
jgi:hypothetical protein